MHLQIIIVGGGLGTRMGAGLAKQFRFLGEKRVAEYTVNCFRSFAPQAKIWLVIAEEYLELAHTIWGAIPEVNIIAGGEERFYSVKRAVTQIEAQGLVFVQDMVRPCVSQELLARCYAGAEQYGTAIPFLSASDTVRYAGKVIERKQVQLIQTPQTFRADWLKNAFKQDFRPEFTDEASVVEQAGYPLHFVQGDRANLKITYAEDLLMAEFLCQNSQFSQ